MLRCATAVLLLLAALSSPAALVSGPERPITAPQVGAARVTDVLALATDGTDFLTLWTEHTGPREGIYATIVNERGEPRPAPAARLVADAAFAEAVWVGDAYLVIAHPYHDATATVMRLNREGQVLSRTQVDLGGRVVTDLAWNGDRVLALLYSGAAPPTAALLDRDGRVLRAGIPIPATQLQAMTATNAGDAFVVAWADQVQTNGGGVPPLTAVRAMRISATGEASVAAELLPPTPGTVEIDSASAGNDAGVAFTIHDYRFQHRDLSRFTIDGPTFAVQSHPKIRLFSFVQQLRVVPSSGGFAAVWGYYPNRSLMLGVASFENTTTTRSIPLGEADLGGALRIATNGRSVVAILDELFAVGLSLNPGLTQRTSNAKPVALTWKHQFGPELASSGQVMLAVWAESEFPGGPVLLAQRRNANGDPLDAQPIVLGRGVSAEIPPAVTFTGRVWLVAWTAMGATGAGTSAKVYVERISPEGELLDAQPLPVADGWFPALASNGKVTALVMGHLRAQMVQLVRFSPDGTLLDWTSLASGPPRTEHVSVATNGEEFLVTWHEERRRIVGRRLAANGTAMDAAPIAIADGPMSRGGARVASNGTDFVVVYAQWTPIPIVDPPLENPPRTIYRVFTKRVLRNGALADTTPDQDGTLLGEGTLPRIAPLGNGFAATFIAAQEHPYDRLTLFALPLDSRGAMLAPPRPVLVNAHTESNVYSLTTIGETAYVAYSRVAPELGDVHRVYLRALTEQVARRRAVR